MTRRRGRPAATRSLAARLAALIVLLALTPARPWAATLTGRIELPEHGAPASDLASAVVWFEPAAGARTAPRTVDVITENKRFAPRVVTVPVGGTVRFPNKDAIAHNVFSVSPGNRFDLGRYRKGEGRAQTFARPGVVRVYCNVHHAMVAYVVVLDTPHVTHPDAGGAFTLDDLPAGRGTLNVWHERAGTWTQPVDPAGGAAVVARMTLQSRPATHLNKHGRPYADEARDDTYR